MGVIPGREAVRPEAVEAEDLPGTVVDPGVVVLDVGRAVIPEAAEEADRADLRAVAVAVFLRLGAVAGLLSRSAWETPSHGEITGSWNSIQLRESSKHGASARSIS